jgi:eukaryotic-like serine/threonine-protein kinase
VQAAPVQIGEMIEGKYRVEGVLGQGAMGIVLRARHVLLDHDVAVKVLHAAGHGDAELRFFREARIAGKLRSEYAARVMDTGTLEEAHATS